MEIKGGLLKEGKDWLDKYRRNNNVVKMVTILGMDILTRMSNILLLPVYLRLMTQDEYGIYNYLLSIVMTFSVVLNFGLYVSQSKYYSDVHDSDRRKTVLFNIALILTSGLLIVLVPLYLFRLDYPIIRLLFKENAAYESFRWPLLLAVVVSVYMVILANYFVTSEKIKLFRKYNLFRLIIINVVVLLVLYVSKGEKVHIRLFYTYASELTALIVFSFFYIREMNPRIDTGIIRNALKLGLPVMVSAILGSISQYCDKFFLEKYGDAKQLSYYYLAFSVANVLYMICVAIQNSWLPNFLKEKDLLTNVRKTNKLIKNMALGLLALAFLLFAAFFVALKLRIIGVKYTPALPILPILLAAQIITGVVLLYSNYMIYFEKTHWALIISVVTSGAGLAASYILVPLWGVFGAGTAYISVQLVYLYLYHRIVRIQVAKWDK